ncbi:conserved hypothetical protein [Methylovorus glucosotrophus SIP3-4]|uniref:Uncharacterized protein n=2 Tax=Methylovorus glucosotrophus TaxID=266009 RepID=C6X888_METGS|nr:conserved hypothetical protein [Methylovorus glucosotrophus SIP3-4]
MSFVRRIQSNTERWRQAERILRRTKCMKQLKQAQAILLPEKYGMTLLQTAGLLGVSLSRVTQLRRMPLKDGEERAPVRGGRKRQNMTPEEEAIFLAPYIQRSADCLPTALNIKRRLDAYLGRAVPLSSVYNLLKRHGLIRNARE